MLPNAFSLKSHHKREGKIKLLRGIAAAIASASRCLFTREFLLHDSFLDFHFVFLMLLYHAYWTQCFFRVITVILPFPVQILSFKK